MKNILFIGGVYSQDKVNFYRKTIRNGYQYAAQALQEALLQGFHDNDIKATVLSIPSVPTFPFGFNSPLLKTHPFIFRDENIGISIGRLNLPFVRREFSYFKYIEDWYKKCDGPHVIFIYSLQARFLRIAKKAKNLFPDVKVCLLIADLPEFVSWNRIYEKVGLRKKDEDYIKANLQVVDCFVLLSKHMLDRLEIKDKPFVVIEGIYNDNVIRSESNKEECTLLYSGNLDKRYGIMDLVKAFVSIPNKNYRLWICGFGDTASTISEYASKDNRIVFYGALPREKVLGLQTKATLLVNPRHSFEVYTKYSFPSKTMEYMASGTPTLMNRLECIPDDYNPFLFYFGDETIEGYRSKIIEILELPASELEERGIMAKKYILTHKTPMMSTKKIIELIKTCL